MPSARYLRITPLMKNMPSQDLELSGFVLLVGNNQLDLSDATFRATFTPTSGTLDFLKRTTIVQGEALGIPKSALRGNNHIYIDLQVAKHFDTFQIGFGSALEKSLLQLKIETSNDAKTYEMMDEVSLGLRLKYRNPWTFSRIPDSPNSGFPGFLQPSLLKRRIVDGYNIFDKNNPCWDSPVYIERDHRTIRTKRQNASFFNGDTRTGSRLFLPISSYLGRGKYYFEVSSESGVNGYGPATSLYFGMIPCTSGRGVYDYIDNSALFGLSTKYSGSRAFTTGTEAFNLNQTVIGASVPPNFENYPGAKTGLLAGFTIDTVDGWVVCTKSPYIPGGNMQFQGPNFEPYLKVPVATKPKILFYVCTPGAHDGVNLDFTFNFGQDPFINPPSELYSDRIGKRWEVEVDPTYNPGTRLFVNERNTFTTIDDIQLPVADMDYEIDRRKDIVLENPASNYYIKGKVKDIEGKFPKRTITLYTWPQMEETRSTTSSTSDGTYEFINLVDRPYAVISRDTANDNFYNDEILGPMRPKPMDPTK